MTDLRPRALATKKLYPERCTTADMARIGRKALNDIARAAEPDTIPPKYRLPREYIVEGSDGGDKEVASAGRYNPLRFGCDVCLLHAGAENQAAALAIFRWRVVLAYQEIVAAGHFRARGVAHPPGGEELELIFD